MVKFMDRFSDFFLKWIYIPTYILAVLWFVFDSSVCQENSSIHLVLYLSGMTIVWFMQELFPKRFPDLEYLEDETDA